MRNPRLLCVRGIDSRPGWHAKRQLAHIADDADDFDLEVSVAIEVNRRPMGFSEP